MNKLWRPVRRLIRWKLGQSARKVLETRTLKRVDGAWLRWLPDEIDLLLANLEPQANELRPLSDLGQLPSAGNRLMVELAIYTAAAYRALLEAGLSRESSRSVVADIGWDVYALLLRLSSLPLRLVTRDPGKRLRGTIGLLLRFPFNAPGAPGYAVEVRREGDDLITHFTHCPPQTLIRTLIAETGDCGDLEAFYESWCRYDWPGADIIANDGGRGHYERRQTLSRGDPVCDMCWKAQARSNGT